MPSTFFGWVWYLIDKYGPLIVSGTYTTLVLAVLGTVFGVIIGLLVAIVRSIPLLPGDSVIKKVLLKIVHGFMRIYIEVFRGTPMIVQAMVIYYGAMQYLHIDMDAIMAGVFIISINTGAYMAEIVRGGIISVDIGQTEAALSIGMTHWQTMTDVVLPQAMRSILPAIGNEFIVNIKDSSVLNVISVSELFFMGKSAAGTYLKYFEVFFIIAMVYLIMTLVFTKILSLIEKKMDGPDTFTIHGSESFTRVHGQTGKKVE